jgi:hypothetical protein
MTLAMREALSAVLLLRGAVLGLLLLCAPMRVSASNAGEDLRGRYWTTPIDAGHALSLLPKGVFLCEWWGMVQAVGVGKRADGTSPKLGDIVGGWVSGDWKVRGDGNLVLSYVTGAHKQEEAVFSVSEEEGKTVLKLTAGGESLRVPKGARFTKDLFWNRDA